MVQRGVLASEQMYCLGMSSPAGAVGDGVFFDVEADFRLKWLRRGLQQRAELLEDLPQRHIVNQQRFVYLGQASENGRVRGDILAHFHESTNDIDAHSDSARAVEDVGGHQRAVLGKGMHGPGKPQFLQGYHSL
jgi:hypothetical protein